MNISFSKKVIALLCLALLSFGLFIATPTQACACGMLISEGDKDIAMQREQGIVIFDSSTQNEQMAIDFQLSGSSNNSALIVPTPVKSEISQIKKEVFQHLWMIASPSVYTGATKSDTSFGAVNVLERKVVGSFEIAVLKTNSYKDLVDWTNNNGFNLEPEAEGPVSAYIDNGFVLNVIKLKKDAVDSNINPLLFTFSTSKYFYPLMEIKDSRNDSKDKSLTLYLITDKKVTIPNADSEFAHLYADPLNDEISKSVFEDEITKTDDKDFSNLKFTSDKYYLTYINRGNYSEDSDLVQMLGNNSNSKEFAALNIAKKPIPSIWGYLAIFVIIIATSSIIFYYFWKRKQMNQTSEVTPETDTINTTESLDTTKSEDTAESLDKTDTI